MTDPRVVVIVITCNRRDGLRHTLTRLTTLPERPAVVVVDNGSTDGTPGMVHASFPQVGLLAMPGNLGAVGRTLGAATVTARYVAFCDDDAWYAPGALSRAADLLDAHPDLAVVVARVLVEPDGMIDPICHEMARSPLHRRPDLPGHPLLSFLAGVSIVRRQPFLATGGFSPRLWLGGEEELLASDLARAGWQMAYVPEVLAHHRASGLRDAHLRRRHGIRNTLWFTWLRRPLPSAAWRTARLLRRLPRDRVSLLGVADAVRGVGWVIRERSVVPPGVERGYRQLEHQQLDGGARRYVS